MGNALNESAKDAKKDRAKSEDAKLDEALDDSFPASDPPAATEAVRHLGSGKTVTPGDKPEPAKGS